MVATDRSFLHPIPVWSQHHIQRPTMSLHIKLYYNWTMCDCVSAIWVFSIWQPSAILNLQKVVILTILWPQKSILYLHTVYAAGISICGWYILWKSNSVLPLLTAYFYFWFLFWSQDCLWDVCCDHMMHPHTKFHQNWTPAELLLLDLFLRWLPSATVDFNFTQTKVLNGGPVKIWRWCAL